MSYVQDLANYMKEINEDKEIDSKGLNLILLGNIAGGLTIIADELHEINMARKAKAQYDLGIISREEMLKVFSGGDKE